MKKRMKYVMFVVVSATSISLCATGCGDTNNHNNTEGITIVTEIEEIAVVDENEDVVDTETEAVVEEATEVAENKPEEEYEVLAIGYPRVPNDIASMVLVNGPSYFLDTDVVGYIYPEDTLEIIGEFYNELEQEDFYRIHVVSGTQSSENESNYGYIGKDYVTFEAPIFQTAHVWLTEGHPITIEYPSEEAYGNNEVGTLEDGEVIEILHEYYNEDEDCYYYRIRQENGTVCYVHKCGEIHLDE